VKHLSFWKVWVNPRLPLNIVMSGCLCKLYMFDQRIDFDRSCSSQALVKLHWNCKIDITVGKALKLNQTSCIAPI